MCYFVAPSGSGVGDGSMNRPWDLQTALNQPTAVKPGSTIWLRGGTYVGAFISYLTGTATSPIVVRQYPGEQAQLDGNNAAADASSSVLWIYGAYTNFWGFEILDSRTARTRINGVSGGPKGISFGSSHDIKLINLVIHDMQGSGIGFWSENSDSEIYGCLIYNNGLTFQDHGIYVQNSTGTKRVTDTIVHGNAGYGLHYYGSSNASMRNIVTERSIIFANNTEAGYGGANIFTGGGAVGEGLVFNQNQIFDPRESRSTEFGIYGSGHLSASLTNNYFANGGPVLEIGHWHDFTFTGNTITSASQLVLIAELTSNERAAWVWNNNTYYFTNSTASNPFHIPNQQVAFTTWTTNTGVDAASSYTGSAPPNAVSVLSNQYESGRAHIVVHNWSQAGTIDVDVSGVLSIGARYEVRNAQNYYGGAILTGTYMGGSLRLPTTGLTAAAPTGHLLSVSPTDSRFAVFVLIQQEP
jgi:Right handed beta helix region